MFFRKSKGLHISEYPGHKELSLQVEPKNYLNPEYIYIPLTEMGAPCEAKVEVGDKVNVGEVVSISKKMWHSSGVMVPCIEIKNDFKETMDPLIKPNDVSKLKGEDIVRIAKDCGIVGLGGSGFPSYVKYSAEGITTVIVNAAECEPFLTADYTLVKTQTDKLIRGIRYVMKSTNATKAYIAIKKNKKAAIEILNNALVGIEDIQVFLLKDFYPAGWEKYIVQRVMNKTYKALPSEVGAVVNNVATLVALSEAVEENMPLIKKLVTFTGEGLTAPQNVYVKIGALTNEVINNIGGYVKDVESHFVPGGLMTGKSLMFDSVVINRSLGSIIVLPKAKSAPLLPCLGCGKCCEACPVFLSPIEIKRALDAKDNAKLAELRAEKCVACGLCSFVCPSRIELTDATTRSRAIVLKGGK